MFEPRNITERNAKLQEIERAQQLKVDELVKLWCEDKEAVWQLTDTLFGFCTNYSLGNQAFESYIPTLKIIDVNRKDNQVIIEAAHMFKLKDGNSKWSFDLIQFAHNCRRVKQP